MSLLLSVTVFIVMLSVIIAECNSFYCYAECHYAGCRGASNRHIIRRPFILRTEQKFNHYILKYEIQRQYLQYFIFFIIYERAQKARVLHCTMLERLAMGKHSSLLGPLKARTKMKCC